ncbi:MAG: heavy-metal-associated domain-containing protein [Fimbriimonadaceae bacterium]
MRETIHLQNLFSDSCSQSVKYALMLLEGVRAVNVHREDLTVDVLFDPPATALEIREQLLMSGYLAETHKTS